MQQELEAVRHKAAALSSASEECGELKARLAFARTAAAAAKQAAQQQEFQLQAQVSYRDQNPPKRTAKQPKWHSLFHSKDPHLLPAVTWILSQSADHLCQGQEWAQVQIGTRVGFDMGLVSAAALERLC